MLVSSDLYDLSCFSIRFNTNLTSLPPLYNSIPSIQWIAFTGFHERHSRHIPFRNKENLNERIINTLLICNTVVVEQCHLLHHKKQHRSSVTYGT